MDTTGQTPSPEERERQEPERQAPERQDGRDAAAERSTDAAGESAAESAASADPDDPTMHLAAPRASGGPDSGAAAAASSRRTSGAPRSAAGDAALPGVPESAPRDEHSAAAQNGHAISDGDGHARDMQPLDGPQHALSAGDWPIYTPAVRSPRSSRDLLLEQRWNRRRRRYTLYVRRTSRARQAARARTVTRFAWATTALLALLIISIIGASAAAAASYYNSETSLINGMQRSVAGRDSLRIYDDKGELLYQLNQFGAQHSIRLAQVPVDVVNATVAIEDHDFWNNDGVDFTSIVRAAQEDLTTHHISQGGSTITQQLIKGQILGGQVTFQRKLYEAILSIGMTTQGVYSKRQILEMYLNSIPYSPTAYGIDAAAQEYFGYQDDPVTGMSAAQHLDLAQASMLAGIPQNPNTNDPLLHPQAAAARHHEVLQAMVKYGYITEAQAAAAEQEALGPHFFHPTTQDQIKAPQFVFSVIDQLQQMIESGQLHDLSRSGLNVYTTLDMDLQNHAQQAMNDHLHGDDRAGFPPYPLIRYANVTNAAEIMAENRTGAIKVYLGSADYNSPGGKFDVIQDGYRGPGSSFKPFVYATAFEKGWFPAMVLNDDPTAFYDAGTGVYKPLDFTNNEAKGQVTLRTALDWSLNIPAVKVMQYAGIDAVKNQVSRMGIAPRGDRPAWKGTWGLSSVLGSLNVTPYEMEQAYSVFANYGQYIPLHSIDLITDSYGNQLFKYQVPTPVQVMDPRIAFLITSMLTDNASREGDFGQCSPLYLAPYFGTTHPHYGPTEQSAYYTPQCWKLSGNNDLSSDAWPTAAKTGTGQNFTDDWTMGYTMDYTTAVWVGNNDYTPMVDIDGVTGAAPIWYQSMIYAEASTGKAKTPFPVPAGVHRAQYCTNGVCTTDWFLDGATPPPNMGEQNEPVPCVTILPQGGWDYSSTCQIASSRGARQNIGAPAPINYHGQLSVGAP